MAGYRLAPKAAKARRNPRQRRRLAFGVGLLNASETATDTLTITDVAAVTALATSLTASDGITITDSASASGGVGTTAQGGMVWLFAPGAADTLIRAASDSVSISDSAAGSVSSAASYSRTVTDSFTVTDVAGGLYRAAGLRIVRDTYIDLAASSMTVDLVASASTATLSDTSDVE
jgi:hypothetical protein